MAGNTVFDVPVVPRLEDLLLDVQKGVLGIPRFQRPFVWDDDRRLMLLDSVAKGFSIGSLLVWRTTDVLDCHRSLGGHKIGAEASGLPQFNTYIMDGHQRIVTLYTALMINPAQPGTKDEREGQPTLPIYVELDEGSEELELRVKDERFHLWNKQGHPPETWLPLWFLFDEDQLDAYRDRMKGVGRRNLANQAYALSKTLKGYPVPLVPYFGTSREHVAESFTRLNTRSQKMSELHIAHALLRNKPSPSETGSTGGTSYDLLASMEHLGEELLLEDWGTVDERILVNALKIHWKISLHGTDPRQLTDCFDRGRDEVTELGAYARTAIGWLRQLGVFHVDLLPYSYQLIGFIEVARRLGSRLSTAQLGILKKWFWRTSFAEVFTGSREYQIRSELKALLDAVSSCEADQLRNLRGHIIHPILSFQRKWVRSRALLLLLQEQAIESCEDGLYPADTRRCLKAEMLFPRRLRSSHPAAYVMLDTRADLEQLEALESPPNLFRTPDQDIAETKLLQRHQISPQALQAVHTRQWERFLELRLRDLHILERTRVHEVGLKMETDAETSATTMSETDSGLEW